MEYIIKVSALIIMFYLCYKACLQRDTFFQTNRWFLISGLLISFCLPFVIIPIYVIKQAPQQIFSELSAIPTGTITTTVESSINWAPILFGIYILGVIFLSIRLCIQIVSLTVLLSKGRATKQDGYIYIETDKAISPFSFFNYIVYNPTQFNSVELEQIISHEKVHVDQLHSIDIFISHIATIFAWFNPIVWFYKKDLQQNLEFIADSKAQSKSDCSKTYQYVLLKTSVPNYQVALTNNFYNSLIKKRIVMLHKNRSKNSNQFKILLVLPILALFLFSFSTKEIITYEPSKDALPETFVTDIPVELSTNENKEDKDTKQNTSTPTVKSSKNLALNSSTNKAVKGDIEIITITKDMSDEDLEDITSRLKKDGLTLKFKDVKRNKNNEITAIQIQAKSKNSNASISETQDGPIDPITIKIEDGSISISNGHDTGHRDYVYETHDGKTKIHKSSKGSNVFVYSDQEHDEDEHEHEHEIIEDDDKIIIKSGNKIKEIKKGKKSKSLWISDDDDDEIIEIKTGDSDGETVIIRKGKDGKLVKSTSKNLWISHDDDDEDTIFELKSGDNKFFLSTDGKDPLFILNGKEVKKKRIDNLKPNSIKSVNVLKGDSAEEKYGKKAKDGVVEITTKDN